MLFHGHHAYLITDILYKVVHVNHLDNVYDTPFCTANNVNGGVHLKLVKSLDDQVFLAKPVILYIIGPGAIYDCQADPAVQCPLILIDDEVKGIVNVEDDVKFAVQEIWGIVEQLLPVNQPVHW